MKPVFGFIFAVGWDRGLTPVSQNKKLMFFNMDWVAIH